MHPKNLAKERIGLINKNNYGSLMRIEQYNNGDDIWVKFLEHGNLVHTAWKPFYKGDVTNAYEKRTFGIGYLGEGNYKSKGSPHYRHWRNMMIRCYDEKYQNKYPSYVGCSVVEEWYNFQNFASWFDENYYEFEGERMELDKDIIKKGNKFYSSDTCVFVPRSINSLFTKRDAKRGEHPIGVHYNKRDQKYVAQCMDGKGNKKALGYHDTPEDAFLAYKTYKEKLIKQIANIHKDKIPNKLYKALINYRVEIFD
jgi:hypothetical protein